ncbi:MAG: GerMN domain-containing protein [Frankia sp.]
MTVRSHRWGPARHVRALAVIGMAAVVLAGCGGLPTPDGVRIDRKVDIGTNDYDPPDILRVPAQPAPGTGPGQLVEDFLEAASGQEDDPAVARDYLAPDTTWDPAAGTVVYQPDTTGSLTRFRAGPGPNRGTVAVTVHQIAVIEVDGAYRRSVRDTHLTFGVSRRPGGDWRVSSVPRGTGLVLTDTDVLRDFREATVYRVARGRDSFVPEAVELPVPRAALAGAIVRSMMGPPGDWLAPTVRTLLPTGTHLADAVTLVSGTVTVDLSQEATGLSDADRDLFAGQLAASMRSISVVTGVRLLLDGRRALPGDGTLDVTSYALPGTAPPDGTGVLVKDGRLVAGSGGGGRSTDDRPEGTLPGATAALAGERSLAAPALSADGRIAGLRITSAGADLVTARAGSAARIGYGPGPLSAPTWVPGIGAAVAVRGGPAKVVVVPARGPAVTAGLGPPGELPGPIWTIRASPDGARIVAIVGTTHRTLYQGRITVVKGVPTFAAWQALGLPPGLTAADDVGWSDGLDLVVLGHQGIRTVLWTVPLGVSEPTEVTPGRLPAGVNRIAAAPATPLLVGDGQRIWSLDGDSWRSTGTGSDVCYPR